MTKRVTPSDIRRISLALSKKVRKNKRQVMDAMLKGEAGSSTSQFSPIVDGITHIRPKAIQARIPREFWAKIGPEGWEIDFECPEATPLIPTHHHTLVKWAEEQKNLDLLEKAIEMEQARQSPRPFVLRKLNEAFRRFDIYQEVA